MIGFRNTVPEVDAGARLERALCSFKGSCPTIRRPGKVSVV